VCGVGESLEKCNRNKVENKSNEGQIVRNHLTTLHRRAALGRGATPKGTPQGGGWGGETEQWRGETDEGEIDPNGEKMNTARFELARRLGGNAEIRT